MREFKPLARKENLVVQDLDDETLIYDLKVNKAVCLNSTAAFVWQCCDGKQTVGEIGRKIGGENLVWLALDQLKKENLIESEFNSKFTGISRREAIKKIGYGSVVALPVIASLIAPPAAQAASCFGDCICTENGNAGRLCAVPEQDSCAAAGCACRRVSSGNSPAGYCGQP